MPRVLALTVGVDRQVGVSLASLSLIGETRMGHTLPTIGA
jgi:hypothetical protein